MKAHLLVSIRKYFDISEEEKELAAAASDQSRLLGRGQRDPGRLLREEKMRKRVNKEKPRVRIHYLNLARNRAMANRSTDMSSWSRIYSLLSPPGKQKPDVRSWFTARASWPSC